jgi:hypothetical protein
MCTLGTYTDVLCLTVELIITLNWMHTINNAGDTKVFVLISGQFHICNDNRFVWLKLNMLKFTEI